MSPEKKYTSPTLTETIFTQMLFKRDVVVSVFKFSSTFNKYYGHWLITIMDNFFVPIIVDFFSSLKVTYVPTALAVKRTTFLFFYSVRNIEIFKHRVVFITT